MGIYLYFHKNFTLNIGLMYFNSFKLFFSDKVFTRFINFCKATSPISQPFIRVLFYSCSSR